MSKRERELMNERRKEMRSYWWGRVLPETCQHLRDLSILTDDDVRELEVLRHIVLEAEKKEVELTWGHQVTKGEVYTSLESGGQSGDQRS